MTTDGDSLDFIHEQTDANLQGQGRCRGKFRSCRSRGPHPSRVAGVRTTLPAINDSAEGRHRESIPLGILLTPGLACKHCNGRTLDPFQQPFFHESAATTPTERGGPKLKNVLPAFTPPRRQADDEDEVV